jgi:KDO2-lipid IV(A) lauroyltransferase
MAKKKFHRPLLYALLRITGALFGLLPFDFAFNFGGAVGRLAFRTLSKERKKTLAHLAAAFPEKTPKEIESIGERVFENYGFIIAELGLLHKLLPRLKTALTLEGREHFDAARAKGKGVMAIAMHFANWELLAGSLCMAGYPGSVIGRRIYYKPYNDALIAVRKKMGLETIYRDESVRKALRALRDNNVVGMLPDQDVDSVDGVFVNFFGKPAYTPGAPVRLAMASGAPLVPCFLIREGKRYRIIIEPPIPLEDSGDKEKDLVANTQKWVSIQERYIRQYPHFWVWNHKRWKSTLKTA